MGADYYLDNDPYRNHYSNPVTAEARAGFNAIDSRISAHKTLVCSLCSGAIFPGIRYLINAVGAKAHAECAHKPQSAQQPTEAQ